MKTGSQSDVFDYSTGEVNQTEAIPPTTRMYPPTTVVVPSLPWVDPERCNCPGSIHRPLCPERAKLFREERKLPQGYGREENG